MGNGSSSRRNGRIQHNSLPPASPLRVAPPPPGYPPSHAPHPGPSLYPPNGHQAQFFYPPNGAMTGGMPPPSPYYPHGYMPQSNGQYMMNYQQQQFRPVPHNPPRPQQTPPAVAETQKANTIRNDVNLKKATLRMEKDETKEGHHLVAFSFDANVEGWISIFILAKEKEQCAFSPLSTAAYNGSRVHFDKGLVQKFRQASESGVNLELFDESDLSKEGEDDVYPLVVRTETLGKDPPQGFRLENLPMDAPVPKYVHCQTTQAVIEKKEDGKYKVRVIKQNIWVDGVQYELQEIYGIENSAGAGGGFDTNDAGKECVICMSEPRDTTVLPCRHMCMCSECAKVLRFQTNRCPICRTPVERLLEIKVPKTDAENSDLMGVTDPYGASASQSSPHPDAGQSSGSPGASARKDEAKVSRGSTQDGESIM